MAARLGQTRTTTRLLRTVGGKPHATQQDHDAELRAPTTRPKPAPHTEGPADEPLRDPPRPDRKRKAALHVPGAAKNAHATRQDYSRPLHERVDHDPVSSDDDGSSAPTKPSKPARTVGTHPGETLRKPVSRKRNADATLSNPEPEPNSALRLPNKAKKTRAAAPRAPPPGQYQQSRAAKEARGESGKENSSATQTPPSSSQPNPYGFDSLLYGSSQGSQKARKTDYSSKARAAQPTSNIHAPRPSAKKLARPVHYGAKHKKQLHPPEEDDDDDSDNVSVTYTDEQLAKMGALENMPQLAPQDPELRRVPKRQKKAACRDGDAADLRQQLGLTDTHSASLPPSSAPQDDMDHIDSYVRQLPAEADEDTACPICHEPVSQDAYWAFWKARPRTVKNQALFCTTHRRASALQEYTAEGYPTIDWLRLSDRIKKHRMALYNILTGDSSSSAYRARYEPLALTGKAAAVPSKRPDLSPTKQRDLAAHALVDGPAVYPGYYGPRGRRAITECVMALLSAEIKRSVDPVVLTSGPATFVQAVLVPEVAVRLIMEDLQCDRDHAEELRERTFDMGLLLHEEIEDEVLVDEGDDGVNEYH